MMRRPRLNFNFSGKFTDRAFYLAEYFHWHLGETPQEIAGMFNVSRSTVERNLAIGVAPSERVQKPHRAPRGCRKRIAERRKAVNRIARTVETIHSTNRGKRGHSAPYEITRKKFGSASQIARQLVVEGIVNHASLSTTRRDLAAVGLVSRVRPWGPARKEGDPETRLAFCAEHKGDEPGSHGFSDEKYADSHDRGGRTEYCDEDEMPSCRIRDRFMPKIHVWGYIAVGVKRLVIFPYGQTLNNERYISQVLTPMEPVLVQAARAGKVFMQDGSRVHMNPKTRGGPAVDWLNRRRIRFMRSWPARSPDLNPIETMWAWVQRRVGARNPPPMTHDEIAEAWREEWDAIPQSSVDALVRSFPTRVKLCIAAKGATIRLTERLKRLYDSHRCLRKRSARRARAARRA